MALEMLLMALRNRRHSATQLALLMSASSLGGRLAGSGFAARAIAPAPAAADRGEPLLPNRK